MKTFEERYTAWIDGLLDADALAAFERELDRRAEAPAGKWEALRVRALLRENLAAPALANADFFSHQLGERIRAAGAAEPPAARAGWRRFGFAWSLPRVGGLAAACAFMLGALYYGLVPAHGPVRQPPVIARGGAPTRAGAPAAAVAQNSPVPRQTPPGADDDAPMELVLADEAQPTPVRDIKPRVPDGGTSATAMRFQGPHQDKNVNVLWLNGLSYVPEDAEPPAEAPNAPAPAPPPSPQPSR